MSQIRRAHLSLLGTTLIFGLHYTVAKALISGQLTPMQVIFMRLLGGMILFWLVQRLFVPEKVERKDLFKLALCGILGFALNQGLFYEGLNLTTPVDASIIHVLNPILVLIFATILIGERITLTKAAGILLGASGALILILFGKKLSFSGSSATGNLLVFLNMIFYALYLVMIKPLVGKYHTTTILKWVSFFAFLFILPFSIKPALAIPFSSLSLNTWLGMAFVILLATFVAYFLINFALQRVSPSVVSYYTYLQPVIASVSSVSLGTGTITGIKVLAALLIFSGVFVVTWQRKRPGVSEEVAEG
jgi:drug/metabolite transporter (DMT)-like permease